MYAETSGHQTKFRGPQEGKGAQRLLEPRPQRATRKELASELNIPGLSEPAWAWAVLPHTVYFEPTVNRGVSARVAVHEVGARSSHTVYVCVHGLFGQSDNWKYVAGLLGGEHELWLIDLPGCGESDCPEPDQVGAGGYGPLALGERVLQALEARLAARPEVSRVILVGHSFGAMVALRMFTDEGLRQRHADALARVEGMVLFAAPDVVLTQATRAWLGVLALNATKAWLGNVTGLLHSAVEESVRSSLYHPELTSRELVGQGVQALEEGRYRRAAQAMLRDAVHWIDFGSKPDWQHNHKDEAGYRRVGVPCLLVWGDCDETIASSTGYKLKDQLPDARLVVIPETKHMLPLERPAICARLIRRFDSQLQDGALAEARSVQTLDLETETSGVASL